MKIDTIEEGEPKTDPIKYPISICFNKAEADRWDVLKQRLRIINKKAKITEFARVAIRDMMDSLEKILEKKELETIQRQSHNIDDKGFGKTQP